MHSLTLLLFTWILIFSDQPDFSHLEKGHTAKNFELETVHGENISLYDLQAPVVLIVLRGFPGYQCPICTRQVGSLISEAEKLAELNASVLFVYPGPSRLLKEKAEEFNEDFQLPRNFYFVLDPDYTMINMYGLRWDKTRETAYPSTFVLDSKRRILFSRISQSHGGRTNPEEIIEVLKGL